MDTIIREYLNQAKVGRKQSYKNLAVYPLLSTYSSGLEYLLLDEALILHVTVEDTAITLGVLQDTFGNKVAAIVKGASELDKSLPWEERKQHTLDFLKGTSQEDQNWWPALRGWSSMISFTAVNINDFRCGC